MIFCSFVVLVVIFSSFSFYFNWFSLIFGEPSWLQVYQFCLSFQKTSINVFFSDLLLLNIIETKGFPVGASSKEFVCQTEDVCLSPGLGRYPGEGNGNPLQYYCLENLMDKGPGGYSPRLQRRD